MNKKPQKKKIIILGIFLILIPIIIQGSINSELVQFNEDNGEKRLKTSGVYADILIDDTMTTNTTNHGNWTWAVQQPWCTGKGTPEEPYIIEYQNFVYNSLPGECLSIQNSRKDFIIRYCNITNSQTFSAGLFLSNVTNGQILNNDIFNNGLGIVLDHVNESIVSNSNIYNSKMLSGIYAEYSYSNTISGNYVYNSTEYGIDLKNCNYNTISGNQIYNNTLGGIWIELSDINTIMENTVYNNSENGILIDKSDSNEISRNIVYNNSVNGIFLKISDFNNLSKNELTYNTESGIYSEQGQNNTIHENNANHNKLYGLYLYTSNSNNVTANTANNNGNYGLYLEESDHNNIIDNVADENKQIGVYLYFDCNDNRIANNNVNNNTMYEGIKFHTNCYNNSIIGNSLTKNFCGINLVGCDFNNITGNIINNNTWGIYIESGSNNNSLYKNFLLKNIKHAVDKETDNFWNSTTIGNYWDNYTETYPNLAIDADDNGIGDVPYNISLSPLIQDHLPIFDDDMPMITIYSPTPGYIFDNNAPSFNVIITDDYLDEMWYTIDGGLHNYSFTENGMISQSAWDTAAEGNITLTFYASDIPGNIGTEEVMITKDYEAPIININSPTTDEFFGSSAPSFNVRITDDYLDTIWYTIDGGLHNYTFTSNGTIYQSAWNSMDDGAISLGFFANDTLSHVGSSEVTLHKDTVAPVIIITSPAEGDKFGNTAPLFNINITEINLDEIWYSYDGGLTTHTITDNGTLNQVAWTALAQGEVTITFYASDLAGNEASESVTVIKSIPSRGLEPGVIITIVIVSVVGGVAVVAGVYIFLKRRATPE